MWTQKQLNLGHVARNKKCKKQTKTNKTPVPTLFGTG